MSLTRCVSKAGLHSFQYKAQHLYNYSFAGFYESGCFLLERFAESILGLRLVYVPTNQGKGLLESNNH